MPNTYSQIYIHYVFSPKYREALIRDDFEEELFMYISGIVKNLGQSLIKINGMPDHCHMLVRLKPTETPSKFIQTVKSNSSGWINNKNFISHKFSWQVGSGIFSVSYRNVPELIKYIANQKEHHKKTNFREEYIKLLKHYGIDFNDDYLFEFF